MPEDSGLELGDRALDFTNSTDSSVLEAFGRFRGIFVFVEDWELESELEPELESLELESLEAKSQHKYIDQKGGTQRTIGF